ncbi:MAG: hypothetical protein KJ941_12935 [Bacteroidetes bacterium]|nr:hypothetical protein [Bacteroidota bacterium]
MYRNNDPGLGSKFSQPVKRLLNPDGSYNINRIGGITGFRDFYTYLLSTTWYNFLFIMFGLYCAINAFFALLYLITGFDGLTGVVTGIPPFWSAFFFSCQTFTTLGYGGIHPTSVGANVVASLEAFVGIFSVALATGLLYGRFSKPIARIGFSKKILLSRVDDDPALLFKIVNLRDNVLLRTKVSCILILDKGITDQRYNKTYHQLKLETDFVLFFPLTWTLVHKIDQSSPLYDLPLKSILKRNGEIVVFLETFDETFGVEILQKHSYAGEQWAEKLKFDMNFNSNKNGKIDLHIRNLNKTIPI